MQIDQSTQRAILNWQSFSIGSSAWVNFSQPGASAVALNRVVGNDPSQIFGRLTANGQVFLVNNAGVLFAPGASVNVNALFATSLSINDQDFLAGRYQFFNPGNAGSVINQGHIVTANGYTALVGPQVRNDGVIIARTGSIVLAAADRVSLDMVGDGLISISVDQATLNASVINTGTLQADGGTVLLAARSANALLDTVINNSGIDPRELARRAQRPNRPRRRQRRRGGQLRHAAGGGRLMPAPLAARSRSSATTFGSSQGRGLTRPAALAGARCLSVETSRARDPRPTHRRPTLTPTPRSLPMP